MIVLTSNLNVKQYNWPSQLGISSWDLFDIIDHMPNNSVFTGDASKITTMLLPGTTYNLGIVRIIRVTATRIVCEYFVVTSNLLDNIYIISLNTTSKSIGGAYQIGMTHL